MANDVCPLGYGQDWDMCYKGCWRVLHLNLGFLL